jgi:nucleoside-diphosphate-sugar epimerase
MRIVIFGASGMVGQGALRECLHDREVTQAVSVLRAPTAMKHSKLREIVHKNFLDFVPIENELVGLHACIYCLGVTSTGTSEENYARITYEFTVAAAKTLLKVNPGISFVFVSGAGADSTERGGSMWRALRAKQKTRCWPCPSARSTCSARQ